MFGGFCLAGCIYDVLDVCFLSYLPWYVSGDLSDDRFEETKLFFIFFIHYSHGVQLYVY